jgi:sirohydrochlorin ferrochelatase
LLVVVHGHSGGLVPELIRRWLAPLAERRGAPVWVQALTAEPLSLPPGERLLVVPLLLTPGSHARFDLPAIRERLRAGGHPVVLLPFLGAWPLWLEHLGQLTEAEPYRTLLHHPLRPGVADRYLVALERRLGLLLSSELPEESSAEAGLLPLALAPNRMTAQLEDAGIPAPALLERPATRDLVFTLLRNLP